jgi:hypothetical protein
MICPAGYNCTFNISVDDPMTGVLWAAFGIALLVTIVLLFWIYRRTGGR